MTIFKKDYIVGLDIGSSSVKLAQFVMKEDGLHLVKADLREIKQSEDSALREQEIVSALKDLFRGMDIKKSKVIAVINCPKTAIKIAKAPYMPKAELRDGISLEAKNYFPFTVDESLLDFQILGDIVEKGIRKYEVIVAVSPKKTVDRYLSLLGKAGIRPASFVPSSYALQNLVEHLYPEDNKTNCFIDIGEIYTELIIFRGRYLAFTRKIPVAGSDFTKAMTGVLASDRGKTQLSLDEAEKIKLETGIPSEVESKIIDDKISTAQILSMVRAPLEQLVNEIERSFDYYREESAGGKIDSVILFGGGAALGGLIKSLSEGLGVEVKLGDPLEGLKIKKGAIQQQDEVSYRLELAIGAALSAAGGINLLPLEIKEATQRTFKRGMLEAVATAVVLVLSFLYIGMKIQLSNYRKRISVAKLELSGLQPLIESDKTQALANGILAEEPYWEDVFKEIGNIIPASIHLTEISMENKNITIKGIIAVAEGESDISDFVLNLENGIFNNVKLVQTEDIKGHLGSKFELRCWID